jgi:hypothetical protein
MALIKKPATIEIAGHTITLDKEDHDRVAAHTWKPYPMDQNRVAFFTELAETARGKQFQLLGGFILCVSPSVFVQMADSSKPLDYRKSNLRVYNPSNGAKR